MEVDLTEKWEIPDYLPYTKSKWTPFAGMKVCGKVSRVVLRGELAVIEDQVIAKIFVFLYTAHARLFLVADQNVVVL